MDTNPIQEKHTILERISKQKSLLEAQGLLNKDLDEYLQYQYSPRNEEIYALNKSIRAMCDAMKKIGTSFSDACKSLCKAMEVFKQ